MSEWRVDVRMSERTSDGPDETDVGRTEVLVELSCRRGLVG
jgi:hypothetical protein